MVPDSEDQIFPNPSFAFSQDATPGKVCSLFSFLITNTSISSSCVVLLYSSFLSLSTATLPQLWQFRDSAGVLSSGSETVLVQIRIGPLICYHDHSTPPLIPIFCLFNRLARWKQDGWEELCGNSFCGGKPVEVMANSSNVLSSILNIAMTYSKALSTTNMWTRFKFIF